MSNTRQLTGFTVLLALGMLACGGGGESAGDTAASGGDEAAAAAAPAQGAAMTVPDWMTVDNDAKTVTLSIEAGKTDANNHWNFNGYTNGDATITVPQGFAVTINFTNRDPAMAHSIGVHEMAEGGTFPAMFQNPTPVFDGAISANPTDAAKATQPGRSETLSFTAGQAGEYAMICYVPAHAVSGMWVHFNVSADGQAGVSTTGM